MDEPILSLLDQIVVATRPKAPGISGGQFPAQGDSPEHRHDLHTKLGAKIKQLQQIILGPFFNISRGFLRNIGRDERADGWTPGPCRGVHPKWAMRRNAIQRHFRLGEGVFDFFGALEPLI